jgi:hypothetical protein
MARPYFLQKVNLYESIAQPTTHNPSLKQRDRERVDGMLLALQEAARHLSMSPD